MKRAVHKHLLDVYPNAFTGGQCTGFDHYSACTTHIVIWLATPAVASDQFEDDNDWCIAVAAVFRDVFDYAEHVVLKGGDA